MTTTMFLQSVINGLSLGGIYCLMALGLTLMFSMAGIINFAHGAVYMLGGYAVYQGAGQFGLPFPVAIILGIIVFGLLGLGVERALFRPAGGDLYAICVALLGLTIFLQSTVTLGFGVDDKFVPHVFGTTVDFFGLVVSADRLLAIASSIPLVGVVFYLLFRTRTGRAMRAVAENPDAALLQGVNVKSIHAITFAVGFALAGVAGALIAPTFLAINPSTGDLPLLKAFIIVILGGMGSFAGAIVGAFLIGLIDSVVATLFGFQTAFLIAYAVIILVLMLKPQGLFGRE